MEYFTTPESVLAWTERGAAFSPHAGADLSMYAEGLPRDLAAINEQATSYRFDASDIMPAPVGTETFWRMMTEYIAGNVDLETALRDIDASWPR
jgi:alpha-glucoside transport system substrate-binding protein